MKAIKIDTANAAAIEAALKAANGRATAHSYISFREIQSIAGAAEAKVVALVGSKKCAVGALVRSTSGDAVSNAYAKKTSRRAATNVTLERRSTGWFLIYVMGTEVWQKGGGSDALMLTPKQGDLAVALFKTQFGVQSAAVVEQSNEAVTA